MKSAFRTLSTFTALLLPLCALAHSHATSTTPANGAVLKAAPTEFVINLNEAAKLTKVTLQKAGEPDAKDVGPLPTDAQQHIRIPAPKLSAGEYTLRYRALGDDGHVVPGTLKFTVAP